VFTERKRLEALFSGFVGKRGSAMTTSDMRYLPQEQMLLPQAL
jgi:hypothetical protein